MTRAAVPVAPGVNVPFVLILPSDRRRTLLSATAAAPGTVTSSERESPDSTARGSA